ncbi:hypothetical protein KUTeg_005798 [Tegillarca granosa]|uniref:HAT C-terminal dimerisation domain-containing protein n=1 Tax=Tegillarca granosa TaxID=220873 RepID=A0ABQ9FK58_TEGGR|nr:hypothetical protein KUTeg_009268 [Tegillarca granosa]KAJ8316645.1 hypothetical protein KUTeg_005798 [Tegillarca granosa]
MRASRAGTAEVQCRASNISRKIENFPFLYMVFFMLDILKVLGNLSLRFQEDNLTLSKLCDSITTASSSFVELKYKKEEIVDAVNTAIDDRFNPMLNDPVIKASIALLDIVSYPEARAELALNGNVELNIVMQHFHAVLENAWCNIASVGQEFREFKVYVCNHRNTQIHQYFVSNDLKYRCKNFLMLIEILLALPISSSVCERGFSAMKRIKSDWRSSLKPNAENANAQLLKDLHFIRIQELKFIGSGPQAGPSVQDSIQMCSVSKTLKLTD